MTHLFFMQNLDFWQIFLVAFVGFAASFIGNAAGSDGFIYLIGMNFLNLPTMRAIGTMKWFSFASAFYAMSRYRKQNSTAAKKFIRFLFPYGVILWLSASFIGSILAQRVSGDFMDKMLPFLTLLMAFYKTIFFDPKKFTKRRISNKIFFYGFLSIIFFYIGFFGPGGATFVIFFASMLIGMGLKEASIVSRHVTFVANVISVLVFAYKQMFYIDVALITIISGIIGTKCSLKFVAKYGNQFINISLIVVLYFVSAVYFLNLK
ncbi:sulfite exporter TauE/SafE family protein [Candidatus Deianiraea vastatrix]|uniref:Probable membrane transporter protein n=1 Tax=Candidatus Deianiraea vastatrix TaxID=2163644 RepID=A0A5B8XDC6_9RICK|nr:sulfite exporter TauE/SafE family protein [Candidatus Deianiraea vastatrix]QED23328.1 Putative transmembrane protein [Candidatus Deianiraea vastatrix]